MALQMSNYLSGRIENVIFFKRSGSFYARAMPAVVKQTASTKMRSRNFGIASTAGKTLRCLLLPVLPMPKDKKMQSRFSGAIAQWLKTSSMENLLPANDIPFVNHFNFSDSSSFAERCKIPIAVIQPSENLIEVHIPAFVPAKSIAAPAHTTSVEFTITAASCILKDGAALGSATSKIIIPYNDEMREDQMVSLPILISAGAIIITAASLTYILSDNKPTGNHMFMPSSVVDARYF